MKRQKLDSARERRILTALIVSRAFLSQVAPILDLTLINAAHFRQIAEWCVEYFKEHGDAPKAHIEDCYNSWDGEHVDSDVSSSVSAFLEVLSDQYEEAANLNVPFLLDEFSAFIAKRQIQRLQEDLEYQMSKGQVKEAEETLLSYRSVEIGAGAGFNPLDDSGLWEEAFEDPLQPILRFAGDAGTFFNPAMTRDSLVAIQAPEKTGKTMWCIEFVMRALRNRKRVAFFQVGDLSKKQILVRLGMRLSGLPLWESQLGKIQYPNSIKKDKDSDIGYVVESRSKKRSEIVNVRAIKRARKRFKRACGLPRMSSYFKVSVHPNSSINVKGISGILDQWRLDHDFIPDVIVVDYADILAPEDSSKQARDQVNDTWRALRRMSQEYHALVIAPTQADAMSYAQDGRLQNMKNFSEDKRKLAHVTGMFGLNQTHLEKLAGGMRLNWIVLRESPFNIGRPLYVGTCFTLGRALCCAVM